MSKQKGFSLIEIMTAVVIVSVSLWGLAQCLSLCVQKIASSIRLSEAVEIAQHEMASAVLAMTGSGSFVQEGTSRIYRWRTERFEKTDNLWLISVTVVWEEKGRPSTYCLSRILDTGKTIP